VLLPQPPRCKANQLTVKGTNSKFASPTYYVYDKNGSLITLVEPSGTTKHAYNAAGLIAQTKWRDGSFTYYQYDGRLQRYGINRNGTAYAFLWDRLDVLQQLSSTGAVVEEYTQAKSPMWGIGQLVEINRPGQTPQKIYPVMDPRGSITKYLQSDGATVVASREYDAFGTIIPNSASGTWPGVFGYQGQAWQEVQSANGQQRRVGTCERVPEKL
jgi:YD repeat-containing protein